MKSDRPAVTRTFVRALVKQILIDGFFHGDPHPGNAWVEPNTGRLVFLDLGLMGELRQGQRWDLLDLLACLNQGDPQGLANVTIQLCEPQPTLDERAFRTDIERTFNQYWVYFSAEASFAGMMNQLLHILSVHGLRLSRELTLAIKAIIEGEVIALTLDPQMNWVRVAFDETLSLLGDQLNAEQITRTLKLQALRTGKALIRQAPNLEGAALKWLDQFNRGRFVVELDTHDLAASVDHFSQTARRLAAGLIIVGMSIGSAIAVGLLVPLQGTRWSFLPITAMIVFLAVMALGAVALIHMLRTTPTTPR